jgi:C-terminal processing protease CtpA/Prc
MLARAQALIVDLRDCRGGSPAMVGYLVGHFVAEDRDVYNTFKSRGPDQYERPTVPIPEPRRIDLPLFVVTSGRTGSGAESLAYTLQAAKRATVVGERTAGGANPGDVVDVGDGLSIFISNGTPVNPITGRNWEGDGVQPDHVVVAARAENAAYELALDAVLARAQGAAADEARWAVESVRAARTAKPLRAEERADLAGAFGSRIVREEGDALVYVVDRRPPLRLIPLGAGAFTPEGAPYTRLEFERDASGRTAVLVVRQVSGAVSRFARTG